MSTGCKSSHNGFLDVSRSNGGLSISGCIGQLSCLTLLRTWHKTQSPSLPLIRLDMAFTFSRLLYAAVVNDRRCIMHFIALARSSATRPFTELGAQRSPVGHNRIECGTFPPGLFPRPDNSPSLFTWCRVHISPYRHHYAPIYIKRCTATENWY